MRSPVLAALLLTATTLPLAAHTHDVASCERASEGTYSVERLQSRLRDAIRASADAGCDPFGGLMGRPGCGDRIVEIRDLAHRIELAGLGDPTPDTGLCADMTSASVATASAAEPEGADEKMASAQLRQTAPPVGPPADVISDRSVRSVGAAFLPADDGRFDAIAKGRVDLPSSAASAVVSWIGMGSPATSKSDRLPSDASLITASVE